LKLNNLSNHGNWPCGFYILKGAEKDAKEVFDLLTSQQVT